jgi:hypothetical protein
MLSWAGVAVAVPDPEPNSRRRAARQPAVLVPAAFLIGQGSLGS